MRPLWIVLGATAAVAIIAVTWMAFSIDQAGPRAQIVWTCRAAGGEAVEAIKGGVVCVKAMSLEVKP